MEALSSCDGLVLDYGILFIWGLLVMPSGVVEILASWLSKLIRRKFVLIWSMFPRCLMWGI